MTRYLYIDADETHGLARAAALGCGYRPTEPGIDPALLPVIVLQGAGQTVVLSDTPPKTATQVTAAAAPIVAAEQAADAAAATQTANDQTTTTALAQAMTRLTAIKNQGDTLAAQNTAWTVAQQKAVAAAISDLAQFDRSLIRKVLNLNDATG